jgi:hypothetical protein
VSNPGDEGPGGQAWYSRAGNHARRVSLRATSFCIATALWRLTIPLFFTAVLVSACWRAWHLQKSVHDESDDQEPKVRALRVARIAAVSALAGGGLAVTSSLALLSRPTRLLSAACLLVSIVVSLVLHVWALQLARKARVPAMGTSSGLRDALETAVDQAVETTPASSRRSGARLAPSVAVLGYRDARTAAPALVFLSLLAIVSLTGVVTGDIVARRQLDHLPTAVRGVTVVAWEAMAPKQGRVTQVRGRTQSAASQGSGPSRSPTPNADVICGYPVEGRFRKLLGDAHASPSVTDNTIALWRHEGAVEIGCPDAGVAHVGPWITTLLRGRSNPTLVLVDDLGQGAVVFQPLVSLVEKLVATGQLTFVGPRVAMQASDDQILFLSSGVCELAQWRPDGTQLTEMPNAVFRALADAAVAGGSFPHELAPPAGDGPHMTFNVGFDDPATPHLTIAYDTTTQVAQPLHGADNSVPPSSDCPTLPSH